MTRFVLCLAVLTLFAGFARAQIAGEGPVVVGYELHAAAAPEAVPGEREPPDAAAVQILTVSAGLPLRFDDQRLIVMPIVSYLRLDAFLEGGADDTIDALHAPMLHVLTRYAFTEAWSGMVLLGAGYASDFGEGFAEHPVITAAALASYRFSPDFALGGGVGYDRRTGELSPLPLVQLDWHFTDDLRLSGVVPARLYFGWRAARWLTVGLRGGLEGERFRLDAHGDGAAELAWSVVKVAPSVVLHAGPIHLDLHAGLSTRRRFEIYVDDRLAGAGGLASTAFFGARLWLGLSGWRAAAEARR